MARGRVSVDAVDGAVVITVDPLTAIDLVTALAAVSGVRPTIVGDITALLNAAKMAAAVDQRVDGPFYRPAPALRLVAGGESA